ncbi:MAG TPA: RNA 2',3'-cyclic phosphodiesterase [Minicystis sp.]|nr:RNA 2',3'-cyclic phosphodiesterase [Minicystis sp.]
MRLFVAVDPSDAARALLANAVARGRAVAPGSKWVAAENLHLTLFFLGHVDDDALVPIPDALARAAARHAAFDVAFEGAGTFGRRRAPSVLWVGVRAGAAELKALQTDVAAELVALGHAAEEREYAPHLTLARARDRHGDVDLAAAQGDLDAAYGRSRVTEIVLYRSDATPSGTRYTAVARAPLG